MKSPITKSLNVKLEKSILVSEIIDKYRNDLNLEVGYLFHDTDSIKLFTCLDTGYQFFAPFDVQGDSAFYEELQNFPWYYMPWKWEHQQTLPYLKKDAAVLEVGCGDGLYLKKIANEYGVNVTGLEMNIAAIEKAQEESLNVLNETIDVHCEKNNDKYDVICCFQVLEHITDVKSFIESLIKCLKKGGKLIICVPNNNSFIFRNFESVLNLPPHHFGLWNKASLTKLGKIFELKLLKIKNEPLQHYHYIYTDAYIDIKMAQSRYLKGINRRFKIEKMLKLILSWSRPLISGHSIIAIYEK